MGDTSGTREGVTAWRYGCDGGSGIRRNPHRSLCPKSRSVPFPRIPCPERWVYASGAVPRLVVIKAREIMHADVLTADPASTALDCARRMAQARKGYAVLLKDGQMVGIVTEWDFLAKVVAREVDPAATMVSTIASAPVASCDVDTPTDVVVERMAREGIRRMVVTQGGRVVGMITSRDVIVAFKPYVDKISADISGYQPSLP